MSDDDPDIEIGTFDPVQAFEQTLHDIVAVVEMFEEPASGMKAPEFLHAVRAAEERLEAIATFTMRGLTARALDMVSPEELAQYQAQRDLDDLMFSPEEKRKRLIKALRAVAQWQKWRPNA